MQSFVGTHKARKTGSLTFILYFMRKVWFIFSRCFGRMIKPSFPQCNSSSSFLCLRIVFFSPCTGILSSSKKQGDTANMPLFELATLCPKEHQVNVRKLKNFLDLNGTCGYLVNRNLWYSFSLTY